MNIRKSVLFHLAGGILLISPGCNQAVREGQDEVPMREYALQSVLWQQRSAEYRALCYQSFNLARMRLDIILEEQQNSEKPAAIITDIDETVLDNSPFDAKLIQVDGQYTSDRWFEWVRKEQAGPVPGAREFLQYAGSRNVEVFYVSNRNIRLMDETMSNMRRLDFPDIDPEHLLLKDSISSKKSRMDIVMSTHRVLLYLGDNLSDFSEMFEGPDRDDFVDNIRSKFGTEFIVFPNPMYGDWETRGIYEGRYDWSVFQRDSIRRAKLISY